MVSLLSLDPATRSATIRCWAAELGFDLIGVARAEPLDKEGRFLDEWLAQGRHADMKWMADRPERRIDPGKVLEGCRSVVVVGVNYHRVESDSAAAGEEAVGRIAQYAQRVDYHRTLGKAVRKLARRIAAASRGTKTPVDPSASAVVAPVAAKSYVDTGPVLEKAWAQRAGLGFIGKNTCLIHPKRGSWFLLGVVLTTLELEPDSPVPEGCGACRRCLEACPTGALVEPGVLDSNRCLSYLTIELRGDTVPENLKERFEDWVFGCDICQEVCPYNRKHQSPSPEDEILGPYLHPPTISLSEILQLETEEEFLARFGRRSPVRRAGLQGMRRNAAAILGRQSEPGKGPGG